MNVFERKNDDVSDVSDANILFSFIILLVPILFAVVPANWTAC
jgi:hypothetical protein